MKYIFIAFVVCGISVYIYNWMKLKPLPEAEKVKILSHTIDEKKNPLHIIAEIKNVTTQKLKYVGADFNLYDSSGKILNSGVGSTKNILPKGTGIIDYYFDKPSQQFTYKVTIKEVKYGLCNCYPSWKT